MAEVRLDVEDVAASGLAATYTGSLSTSNTYKFYNDGRVILHCKKSSATDATVTLQTPITVGGLAVAEPTVTIPGSTGDKFIGPFSPRIYNDGHDVKFTIPDNIDGLTIAVLKVGG